MMARRQGISTGAGSGKVGGLGWSHCGQSVASGHIGIRALAATVVSGEGTLDTDVRTITTAFPIPPPVFAGEGTKLDGDKEDEEG